MVELQYVFHNAICSCNNICTFMDFCFYLKKTWLPVHKFSFFSFLAHLDKVQEELLYYCTTPTIVGILTFMSGKIDFYVYLSLKSKMLKFHVKVFYVMGKALSGEPSCPCDRSCYHYDFDTCTCIAIQE